MPHHPLQRRSFVLRVGLPPSAHHAFEGEQSPQALRGGEGALQALEQVQEPVLAQVLVLALEQAQERPHGVQGH